MKITTLLLLITVMTVSAATYAQKINLHEKKASLEQVLEKIRIQSGYDLIYSDIMLDKSIPVTINLKDATLDEALRASLEGQPLSYLIQDGTVVFKVKEATFIDKLKNGFAAINVTGRVIGDDNQPLAGATVKVKDGTGSTVTDVNGFFSLTNVDPGATLQISFIGYAKLEVQAKTNLGLLKLSLSDSKLDEVKIIAYGQTTERLSTGNTASVSAKDIEKQPVSNPLLALEGRVPGLFITQANGLAGGAVTVQIQGQNSIGNGNDPFYVVDGVPYTQELLLNLGNILGSSIVNNPFTQQYGNPLNYINPSDIESISILKDADATAIYGSRAANGAIIITTKKGKAGATKADFNLQQGWGQVTRKLGVLNAQQYLDMRREAFKNDGIPIPSLATTPTNTDWDINGLWDTNRSTDWQKVLLGNTAQYTNLNGSVSGGSETTQFLVGGTYHRETSVFPGSFADEKGALHFNLTTSSTDQKFRMQFSGNYLVDNNQLPGADLTASAISLAPVAPALYNPDGSINWQLNSAGSSTWTNPLSYTLKNYNNLTNNLTSNALLSYSIFPGLDIRSSFGYTNMQTTESLLTPLNAILPQNRAFQQRNASYGSNNIHSWIIEPQATYQKTIGKGQFTVLLGATIQQNTSTEQQIKGTGYVSDALLEDVRSAASLTGIGSFYSRYKYNAVFTRLSYNWDDKYLLNLTARRDGSSRFGPANQFHNFGAAGMGWVFSKENFIENVLPVLSFGKLSASYGTTGNDQITDYQFYPQYNSVFAGVAYQGIVGIKPSALANPYLQWEETKKLDFGLNLGFVKDRILLSTHYFQNRSSNELLAYNLSIVTGFPTITSNFPATVQNSGWEFTLNSNNVKSSTFNWSTNFNLTIPRNKLVDFPNLASSSYASQLVVGYPLLIVKRLVYAGVNSTTGLYQFIDNGTPSSNPTNFAADLTSIIDLTPRFYGGLSNTFRYKSISLDFLFQFVKQKGLSDYYGNSGYSPAGSFFGANQPVTILNRWQQAGDNVPIQKFTSSSFNASSGYVQSSDALYSDASYIRLKNISLSWELPKDWVRKARLQNLRIFAQGQNLLTITKYKGLDPENTSVTALPPLCVLTMGLQLGL